LARGRIGLLAACVLVLALAFGVPSRAQQGPSAAGPADMARRAAKREAWSPGEHAFIRSWRVRGATAPLADEANQSPDGSGAAGWSPYKSWGDTGELDVAAGGRGSPNIPRFAYAFATIDRAEAGPAEISIGATAPVRVWVNGRHEATVAASRAFGHDAHRIPVTLRKGANRLLLRSENRGGPWLLSARLLNPNQPLPALRQLVPSLEPAQRGLAVRTDRAPAAVPATVSVIAPGGRIVASAEAARGETVRLDTESLPEGPYEVRVESRDAFGRPVRAHLPWVKGDVATVARRMLDQSRIPRTDAAQAGHWAMLAALLTDRAGADLQRITEQPATVHSVLMEAAEVGLGDAAQARALGFVRLAWIDEVDGSIQFCRAYLPAGYDGLRSFPVVLNLHGFNPPNPPYVHFWSVDMRHHDIADSSDVIWIDAHGRANSQYIGIGEADVLRCLDEAQRRLKVDADRVYLTGESMGGSGAWLVGARNADRFAALAPIFGGWDRRVVDDPAFAQPGLDRPMERWQAETQASFASAEQLINTPVFVQHGDADADVPVDFSRHIVERLQRWGYDIRYRERPGAGHEDLNYRPEVVAWMLGHRRPEAPAKARVRSIDLGGAKNWWLRVDAAERPLELIEADAEMVEPGLLRLDTRNVAALTLSPPAGLLADPARLRLVWNGRKLDVPGNGGAFRLTAPGAPRGPMPKSAALPGGLSHFFTTPFAIVVGTSAADPQMRSIMRQKAELLAGSWRAWQHVRPRVIDDTEVTPAVERAYSLLLVGGPGENRVARRLASRLPFRIGSDSVTVDGRSFPARDAVLEMIRPSPSAADRYVLAVAPTSTAGMYVWSPASFWHPVFGYPTRFHDWTVRDGRMPRLAQGMSEDRAWVASGMFDQRWRRDDRYTFLGDAELRAAAHLRRIAPPKLVVPAATLDSYVGRYELRPNVVLTVARAGDGLSVQPPGGPPIPVITEGPNRFASAIDDGWIEFVIGADGRVTGAVTQDLRERNEWRRID
jgi:dienelactone hydrolase